MAELGADHPGHVANLRVLGFKARIPAAVLEDGAGLAAFDLLVLVVGIAELALDRFEPAGGVAGQVSRLAFQRKAVLPHLQPHVVLGGRAVLIAVGAVVGADEAVGPGVGTAHRAAFLLRAGIGQAAIGFGLACGQRIGGAQAVAAGVAGDAQVAGFAREGVGVDGELAVAGLDQRAGVARLVAARGGAGIDCAADAFDRLLRNPVVDHIDHAADGVAAVHQRRRAAHDLDALGHERVHRHGVVIGQRRGVDRGAAVLQHLDAVAVQAADHRPAGIGPEVAGRNPGQLVERVAQRAALAHGQGVAAERRYRRHHVVEVAAERVGGDDDFAQRGAGRRGGSGRGGCAVGGRCRGGLCQRGGRDESGGHGGGEGSGKGRQRGQARCAGWCGVTVFRHGARSEAMAIGPAGTAAARHGAGHPRWAWPRSSRNGQAFSSELFSRMRGEGRVPDQARAMAGAGGARDWKGWVAGRSGQRQARLAGLTGLPKATVAAAACRTGCRQPWRHRTARTSGR
ncbi:hypothetical protein D9M72_357210 [compost metagenome]